MTTIHDFPSNLTSCKVCAHSLTRCASEDETPPAAGDIVLCGYCGALYVVDDTLVPVLADGPARELLIATHPSLRFLLVLRAVEMGFPEPVDLQELAGYMGPIRDELVAVRARISTLLIEAPQDRTAISAARKQRGVLRRLLNAVQEFIDSEVLAQAQEVDHA